VRLSLDLCFKSCLCTVVHFGAETVYFAIQVLTFRGQPSAAPPGGSCPLTSRGARVRTLPMQPDAVHGDHQEIFTTFPKSAPFNCAVIANAARVKTLDTFNPMGAFMQAAVLTKEVRSRSRSSGATLEGEVTVSVAEAAKLCKVSGDTIRRRLHDNVIEGAFQDGLGESAPWCIPVPSLIAVGLCEPEALDELDQRLNPNIARLSNQLVGVRAELLAERTNREAAERAFAAAKDEVSFLRKFTEQLLTKIGDREEGRTN